METDRFTHSLLQAGSRALTRRGLLQAAGCALAATAFRPLAGFAGDAVSPEMTRLSTYMSDARSHALPPEVADKTRQHILDTFAAMISGSGLLPGRDAIAFARGYRGERIATVAACDVVCGAIEAALANGMLAHSDETDDSHAPSLSHPGCAVVPAALAAGEQFGIGGAQFLRAVALGYDVGTRVTMTLGGDAFQTATHRSSHSIAGTFGASAAAGCAAGLDAHQMRWLLDYAAQQASGVAAWQRDTQHIEKAFVFAGMPARNGVTAALLVHSGWTGIGDVFSGANNFLLANNPHANPSGLVDQLGRRYEITHTNIKKWTVGSPIQAPLDAVEILLKRHPFYASQVRRVVVRVATTEAAVVNNRSMPDVCLQHMVALMIVDKTVTFRSAHDVARMKDPAVLAVRAKVQLVPDEQLEKLLPRREATVEITLSDGTVLREHVAAVRGTAANPMTREEVVAKARDLMVPVLGASQCTKLIAAVLDLESTRDVHSLRPLLQKS